MRTTAHIIAIWFALQLPIGIIVGTHLRNRNTAPRKPGADRGLGNFPRPAPVTPHAHQPLHHGSNSLGSVGSLGSIHFVEVKHA